MFRTKISHSPTNRRRFYGFFSTTSPPSTHSSAMAMNPRASSHNLKTPQPNTRPVDSASTDGVGAVVDALQRTKIGAAPKPLYEKASKRRGEKAMMNTASGPSSGSTRAHHGKLSRRPQRDAIKPPSKGSGGIPSPTAAYLAASLEPLQPLKEAQHLLVVIDLNGTLLFRPNKRNPTEFIARPNSERFLRYCIETFTVVIWSSARPANVQLMCNQILKNDLRSKVVAIWARDKFNLTPLDFDMRTMCYKRLTSLWNDPDIASTHPGFQFGARWDHTNTVLVDDSPEKGRSEPFNLIAIPEFAGDRLEKGGILPQVHDYINTLSMHSNVAAYMKARPFKAHLPETPPVPLVNASQIQASAPVKPASNTNCKYSKVLEGLGHVLPADTCTGGTLTSSVALQR